MAPGDTHFSACSQFSVNLGILHLVFNMLWLNDLGSSIEHRYGTPSVLCHGAGDCHSERLSPVVSTCQLDSPFSGGWSHGGMSGVVYGLVGFLWIRTAAGPHLATAGYDRILVMFMVVWLFLCVYLTYAGTMHIANLAHAAGFALRDADRPRHVAQAAR